MGLNNRAANRESHPHTIGFGRIERFEDLIRSLGREPYSRISRAEPHLLALSRFSSNQQLPWARFSFS
jgi:hypothetical protein